VEFQQEMWGLGRKKPRKIDGTWSIPPQGRGGRTKQGRQAHGEGYLLRQEMGQCPVGKEESREGDLAKKELKKIKKRDWGNSARARLAKQ